MTNNQPTARFKYGSITASIFENEVKKNGKSFTMSKVVLQKSFLDKNEQWQTTSSLDTNDVPKAIMALSKAYDFVTRTDTKTKETTEFH
jgi:hypothetical protein